MWRFACVSGPEATVSSLNDTDSAFTRARRTEAANTAAFGAAHASLPLIAVPRVLAASRHVLVSEWVVGRSPNQLLAAARGGDSEARAALLVMVREGIQCSITQLLVTGVLHGEAAGPAVPQGAPHSHRSRCPAG